MTRSKPAKQKAAARKTRQKSAEEGVSAAQRVFASTVAKSEISRQ